MLQILAEAGEESIAQLLGGPSSKSGAIMVVFNQNKRVAEERGHMHLSSTSVKILIFK